MIPHLGETGRNVMGRVVGNSADKGYGAVRGVGPPCGKPKDPHGDRSFPF